MLASWEDLGSKEPAGDRVSGTAAESRHRRVLLLLLQKRALTPPCPGVQSLSHWLHQQDAAEVASRASEDQRSCLLWKPALGDQLRERPRLPGLPERSPGLCGGRGQV